MSPMSDLIEQTQALETLINAIVINKTKDLESEIKQLRKEMNKLRVSSAGIPPYIFVEYGNGRGNQNALVISRQAAETCHSKLMFYTKLTSILRIKATHSEVDPKTTEIVRYAPMRVLGIFDPKNESPSQYDWCEIAEWDESIPGVLAAVVRLKVII
ncbi:hypothetical protein Clacol_004417 [Clathrus columnatus]|uniref:Uncharacterized protein n=1 Tax=Clathrus columnatus TaxID=1419009 RepID=A0AAV5ACH6_9AGAM|nr:hypothetical protein Clacol_004417 [Clathrus columnatus]